MAMHVSTICLSKELTSKGTPFPLREGGRGVRSAMLENQPLPDMPAQPGLGQLHWLIQQVAEGRLPVGELIANFRLLHEAMERGGRPQYRSKDEARLIWDVLWALEFYSSDPSREPNPSEWNDDAAVLTEVQRVYRALKEL